MIENNQLNQNSLQNTPVDPETIAKQNPKAGEETQQQFIPQVKSSDPIKTDHHTQEADRDRFLTKNMRYIQKAVVWILTAQGLFGIYKSIRFILVEFPKLGLQLSENLITQNDINGFASKAILMAISATVGMIFALKLSAVQNKTAKRIQITIGIILALTNAWITAFLNSQQSGKLIGDFAFSLLQKFQ